jgi:hypothetical protein
MRFATLSIALAVAGSAAAQTLPKRQLVEEVRLDATTEDFPDVSSVLVNRRGEMAVIIGKDQQLRFFDATGRKLGTFGRVGSGPGEFRRVTTTGWTGDTIWLYDSDQRRVTYISPDHKLLRTELLNPDLNMMMGRPVGSPAPSAPPKQPGDGAVVLFTPRAIVSGKYVGQAVVAAGKTADGRQDSKTKLLAIRRDVAATSDQSGQLTPARDSIDTGALTFLSPDPPSISESMMRWSQADGRASASMVIPFSFTPATIYSSDGDRIGFLSVEPSPTGGTYTLRVMTTSGKPVFTRAYPFVGIPIPRHVADSVIERMGIQPNGRQMFQPAAIAQFHEEARTRMLKFFSPVSLLYMNPDNTSWIQLRRSDPTAAASVILIDERGNQVATFDLPPRTRIVQATRDHIWTVVTDEDDLPSVVRFRVK